MIKTLNCLLIIITVSISAFGINKKTNTDTYYIHIEGRFKKTQVKVFVNGEIYFSEKITTKNFDIIALAKSIKMDNPINHDIKIKINHRRVYKGIWNDPAKHCLIIEKKRIGIKSRFLERAPSYR